MFYLVCAILSSACISVLMRISKNYTDNQISLLSINYIICTFLSLLYTRSTMLNVDSGMHIAIGLGILNGIIYLLSFWLLQRCIQANGVILSSLFQKLGIIIPTLVTIFVFKEIPTLKQYFGIVLSILCILVLQLQKKDEKHINLFLLLFLLIGNGMGDAMSKIYEKTGTVSCQSLFLLLTFIVAFVLSFILLKRKHEKINRMDILFGCLIGIPNYFSAHFLLKSLYSLPAILVYPAYSVFTILTVSVCGFILFHEKLKLRQGLAFVGILVSLLLLN